MTKCDIFENAIIEFGIDAALEYFATPKEHHRLWDDLKKKAKVQRFEMKKEKDAQLALAEKWEKEAKGIWSKVERGRLSSIEGCILEKCAKELWATLQ